jgi:hypothetical protein
MFNLMRNSIIQTDNIIVKDNSLQFNYKIQIPSVENSVRAEEIYISIGSLIKTIFEAKQIRKERKLSIIIDKCEKGIYKSVAEVLKDFDSVMININKNVSIKEAITQKTKKTMGVFVKFWVVLVIVLVAYALYKNYITQVSQTYLNKEIHTIGTVNLEEPVESTNPVQKFITKSIYINNSVAKPTFIEEIISALTPENKELKTDYSEEGFQVYTTKYGDCLSVICYKKYKSIKNVDFIAQYNNIQNKHLIYVNQNIILPTEEFIKSQQTRLK